MIRERENEPADQKERQHGLKTRDRQIERRVSKCPADPTGDGVCDQKIKMVDDHYAGGDAANTIKFAPTLSVVLLVHQKARYRCAACQTTVGIRLPRRHRIYLMLLRSVNRDFRKWILFPSRTRNAIRTRRCEKEERCLSLRSGWRTYS